MKRMITFLVDGKDPQTMSYLKWNLMMSFLMTFCTVCGAALHWICATEHESEKEISKTSEDMKALKKNYIQVTKG